MTRWCHDNLPALNDEPPARTREHANCPKINCERPQNDGPGPTRPPPPPHSAVHQQSDQPRSNEKKTTTARPFVALAFVLAQRMICACFIFAQSSRRVLVFRCGVILTCAAACVAHVHTRFLPPLCHTTPSHTTLLQAREHAYEGGFGALRVLVARGAHSCVVCLCSHLGFSRRVIHQPPCARRVTQSHSSI